MRGEVQPGARCMVSWFVDRSFLLFFVLLTLCTAILSRPSFASRSFCLPAHERERDPKGTKKDRAFVSGMCRDRVEISKIATAQTQGYDVRVRLPRSPK